MWLGAVVWGLSVASASDDWSAGSQVKLVQEGQQLRILVEAVGVGDGLTAFRPGHSVEVAPLLSRARLRWKGGRMALPVDAEWTSSPHALEAQPLGSTWWDLGELRVDLPPEALAAGDLELVGRVQLTLQEQGVVRLDKHRVSVTLSPVR